MLKQTHTTHSVRGKDIKRAVVVLDAQKYILGRLATEASYYLQGKNKVNFTPNLDMGDYVVVINAAEVHVSGKKEQQKVYSRYSGYPGGLYTETLGQLRERKPEEIIKRAVSGMLPNNKLRSRRMTRLLVFPQADYKLSKEVLEITTSANGSTK